MLGLEIQVNSRMCRQTDRIIQTTLQTSSSGRLDPLCEASPAASSSSEKPKKKKAFHKRGFTLGRLGGNDRWGEEKKGDGLNE